MAVTTAITNLGVGRRIVTFTGMAAADSSPTINLMERLSSVVDYPRSAIVQAFGTTSSGAGAAVVTVSGSLDGTNWATLGTINLTLGTAATNDGFGMAIVWPYMRATLTSMSGTGAAVTVKFAL